MWRRKFCHHVKKSFAFFLSGGISVVELCEQCSATDFTSPFSSDFENYFPPIPIAISVAQFHCSFALFSSYMDVVIQHWYIYTVVIGIYFGKFLNQ